MLSKLTVKKAVEFAITTEELGARVYGRMAQRFRQDRELAEIFSVLASDEKVHREQFATLLQQVPDDEASAGPETWQYLRAMSISEFFAGEGKLTGKVEEVITREDALTRALGMEKATLQYYEAMREVLGTSEVLEAIIKAEKSHVLSVMRYLITEAKVRGVPE